MTETIEAAEALFAQGQIEQAQSALESLSQIHPQDPRILNDLGVVCFVRDQLAQAEGYFLRSLEADPDNGQAMANLADVYRRQGRWAETIGWVHKQMESFAETTELLNQLAVAHLEMGQPAQARPLLQRSLEIDPEQIPVRESLNMLNQGQASGPSSAQEVQTPPSPQTAQQPVDDLSHLLKLGQSEQVGDPQVDPPAGNDQTQSEELVGRICEDPDDSEAFSQARQLVANRSVERLRRNPEMAWLSIACALKDKSWNKQQLDLVSQIWPPMPSPRRQGLLRLLLAVHDDAVETMLHVMLPELKSLPDDLAEALGRWVEKIQPTRQTRDLIERTICLACQNPQLVRRIGRYEGPARPLPADSPNTFLPRRIFDPIQPDEEFCHALPVDAPDKQGGMRVLLVGQTDVFGALSKLARALNRHTRHVARCVVINEDDCGFADDLIIRKNQQTDGSRLNMAQKLIQRADFIHFLRKPVNISRILWDYYVSPRNCLVQYTGEYMRSCPEEVEEFHRRTGITAVTSGDRELAGVAGNCLEYISPYLLELDALPSGPSDFQGPLRICHSPTGPHYLQENHSHQIQQILDRLRKEHPQLEARRIEGLTNAACLEAKSHCHIHFVSLGRGLGMGAIESAAMGVVPVLRMTNAWRMLYPDCPFVCVTEETAAARIRELMADRQLLAETSKACMQWARQRFDVRQIVKQYAFLYDYIVNGLNCPPQLAGEVTP
ncbi:MAG: tetratricopeptide repeat protein [Phycisphaerae bacterium]